MSTPMRACWGHESNPLIESKGKNGCGGPKPTRRGRAKATEEKTSHRLGRPRRRCSWRRLGPAGSSLVLVPSFIGRDRFIHASSSLLRLALLYSFVPHTHTIHTRTPLAARLSLGDYTLALASCPFQLSSLHHCIALLVHLKFGSCPRPRPVPPPPP